MLLGQSHEDVFVVRYAGLYIRSLSFGNILLHIIFGISSNLCISLVLYCHVKNLS